MEFEEAQAKMALRLSNGNVEYAINLLFSGQPLVEPSFQMPSQPSANQDLTPLEMQSVERLKAIGFSDAQAKQAYIASSKNEELAADLLI